MPKTSAAFITAIAEAAEAGIVVRQASRFLIHAAFHERAPLQKMDGWSIPHLAPADHASSRAVSPGE